MLPPFLYATVSIIIPYFAKVNGFSHFSAKLIYSNMVRCPYLKPSKISSDKARALCYNGINNINSAERKITHTSAYEKWRNIK